jgi:tetratricopeptide (TPR) repeat protein
MTKTELQIAFSEAVQANKIAMNTASGRVVLTCIFILTVPIAAWCEQTAKEHFNPTPNVQSAITYTLRAAAEERKGDLNGAMADCNLAIKLNPQNAGAYYWRGNVNRKRGR